MKTYNVSFTNSAAVVVGITLVLISAVPDTVGPLAFSSGEMIGVVRNDCIVTYDVGKVPYTPRQS